jgi:hypothetical protein
MKSKNVLLLLVLSVSLPKLLLAQKNEVSFAIGGIVTSDQSATSVLPITCPITLPNCNVFNSHLTTDPGVALKAMYARRLVRFGRASLYVEIPVVSVPGRNVDFSFTTGGFLGNTFALSSSAFFFTPSARVSLFSSAPVSPFVSVGGGLAHTGSSFNFMGISSSTRSNSGALQYGGGLDVKSPIPWLGFRGEVRDFYSGSGARSSPFNTVSPERLHHVFAGGGVVLRF